MSAFIERIKNEPVVLIVLAAGLLTLGVDLDVLTETVEKIVDLAALVGLSLVARQQVTPVRKLADGPPLP